jgi:hypothetical protein
MTRVASNSGFSSLRDSSLTNHGPVMFAPIARRFQTYDVDLEGHAKNYMDRLLEHPLVAEWLRLGQEEVDVISTLEVGS